VDRNLLVILFLFLSLVLGYVLLLAFPMTEDVPPVEASPPAAECNDGQMTECTLGSCPGKMTCTGGEWGRCMIAIICDPGKHYPCREEGCSEGYRICNSCGTGYGDCITK